jgi:hypothetical protein
MVRQVACDGKIGAVNDLRRAAVGRAATARLLRVSRSLGASREVEELAPLRSHFDDGVFDALAIGDRVRIAVPPIAAPASPGLAGSVTGVRLRWGSGTGVRRPERASVAALLPMSSPSSPVSRICVDAIFFAATTLRSSRRPPRLSSDSATTPTSAQDRCEGKQMLERQVPRLEELGTFLGVQILQGSLVSGRNAGHLTPVQDDIHHRATATDDRYPGSIDLLRLCAKEASCSKGSSCHRTSSWCWRSC